MRVRAALAAALVALTVPVFADPLTVQRSIILATTTSTQDSGLLDDLPRLLAAFDATTEFSMVVEERLDLVDHVELLGRIGNVRVHVRAGAGDAAAIGERISLHAERVVELPAAG